MANATATVPRRNGLGRYHRFLQQALVAVNTGRSIRKEARIARMSVSGFHYRVNNCQWPPRRSSLTAEEEVQIVEILLEYSRNGR